MIIPGFVGPSYNMDARSFDCQRSINLFPLTSESGTSVSPNALRKKPGKELFATAGGGPIRGCIEADGRSFWVSGAEFYEVDTAGVSTLRGSLLTATSRCTVKYNGTQVFIVDGTYGYIFNLATNDFNQITSPGFPSPAVYGEFQDNYFIAVKGGTAQFYISAIGDGTTWDILDFTTVESSPDDLVAIVSDGTNLWALGKTTVEVYANTGAAAFPFERVPGAVIQSGCAAPFSAIIFDNALTWLGQDDRGGCIVWRANGYQATRISTQAIESAIAQSSNPVESYAYTYYEQGHAFYMLQCKGLETTLVADAATGYSWHERSYRNAATFTDEQDRGTCHVYFNNQNLVGDSQSGIIYNQSLSLQDDNGDEIIWVRIFPHLVDEKKLITHSVLELECEVGRGLNGGGGTPATLDPVYWPDGSLLYWPDGDAAIWPDADEGSAVFVLGENPQVMMKYSNDGGFTWSNERWVSAGRMGQYNRRVRWTRLGAARDRVFWLSGSDPTFVQLNAAYLNND